MSAEALANRVVVIGGEFGGIHAVSSWQPRRSRSRSSTGATSISSSRSPKESGDHRSRARGRRPASAARSGPLAWILWLVVHLWYLIRFQNRLLVMIRWTFSFVTRGR